LKEEQHRLRRRQQSGERLEKEDTIPHRQHHQIDDHDQMEKMEK
jgi:hypothetical protein